MAIAQVRESDPPLINPIPETTAAGAGLSRNAAQLGAAARTPAIARHPAAIVFLIFPLLFFYEFMNNSNYS